jgi:hypothetical protein
MWRVGEAAGWSRPFGIRSAAKVQSPALVIQTGRSLASPYAPVIRPSILREDWAIP